MELAQRPNSYCIACAGSGVPARVREAIDYAVTRQQIVRRGAFLWLKSKVEPPVRAADTLGQMRPFSEVVPEEISGAVLGVIRPAFAMSRDDLLAAAAQELGYDRKGGQVSPAMGEGVETIIRQ